MIIILLISCVIGINNGQFYNNRPHPTYSLQKMPETRFSCRDKILGGYYADRETQCQMFHVCVKIPGIGVQNFRFLCPNGTAFDQDNQICADWYDVDCEAETLYYGSDNFDLYRIGSGFETKAAPSSLNEDEETFHLQKSETGDLRLNRDHQIAQINQKRNHYSREQDILRGSSSSNFFNNKNNGKEDEYEDNQEPKRSSRYYQNVNQIGDKTKKVFVKRISTKRPESFTHATTNSIAPSTRLTTTTSTTTTTTTQAPTTFRSTQTTNFLSEEQYTTAINNYRSRQLYSARRKLETLRTVSATLPTLAPTTYPTTEPQYYFKKTINRGRSPQPKQQQQQQQQQNPNRYNEDLYTEVPIEKTDVTKTFFKKYSDPNTFKNLQSQNRKLDNNKLPITTYRSNTYKFPTTKEPITLTTDFVPLSDNDESLKTAHSTNFASSKNELSLSSKFEVGFNVEEKNIALISDKKINYETTPYPTTTTTTTTTTTPVTTSRRNYFQELLRTRSSITLPKSTPSTYTVTNPKPNPNPNPNPRSTTVKSGKKYDNLADGVDTENVNANLEKNRNIDASYDYAYYDSNSSHEDDYIGDLEFNKSASKQRN